MTPTRVKSVLSNWNTIRYELLNSKICDLGLKIDGSPIEMQVERVRNELAAKRLKFKPPFYLTDSWGCPNEVPVVGIPFYLADARLTRIEEEQTGEVEDSRLVTMFLRHEVGHAVNYAYRLWEKPGWTETFGLFSKPYLDHFRPDPASRNFVRHLSHTSYGRHYAQKHPDEDFAETFAVWLTPRSAWRRKYRSWPAYHKLKYVAALMQRMRDVTPAVAGGKFLNPVEEMRDLLIMHYGQRAERYRAAAEGYVDDKLREVFPPLRGRARPAADVLRRHHARIADSIARWSGLQKVEVDMILDKLEDRAQALRLMVPNNREAERMTDATALATSLAMDFAYTGRFTG